MDKTSQQRQKSLWASLDVRLVLRIRVIMEESVRNHIQRQALSVCAPLDSLEKSAVRLEMHVILVCVVQEPVRIHQLVYIVLVQSAERENDAEWRKQ